MIRSFGDPGTRDLFHGKSTSRSRRVPTAIRSSALRKLDMLNAASSVNDLRSPPGNRLELLRGDLKGFRSIRINEQWRIIFEWAEGAADNVQIVDYHR